MQNDDGGFLIINNISLSSKAPALRGEDNFLDLVIGKLEKAMRIAQERNLIPVITGTFATKGLDVELFKRLYPVLNQYPELVIIASGNMLEKRSGEVKPRTMLDLVKSMNLCEVLAPADEQEVEVYFDGFILRLTVGEKGEFAISTVDEETDSVTRVIGSDERIPSITRLTHDEIQKPAQVTIVTGKEVSFIDIETKPPLFMDTRFDINRNDDDFSSELVNQLKELFDRTNEEQPEVEMSDQLKSIFEDKKTSERAKRIVLQIQKDVELMPG